MIRRGSLASFDGSYGMGDVTRTPCDASIDIEDQRDTTDHTTHQQSPIAKKEGGCCHSKKDESFTKNSEHEDQSKNHDYRSPPPYYSDDSLSNSDDRSDGDSGVSNAKYAVAHKDSEELGIMMSNFHGKEKLVSTAL